MPTKELCVFRKNDFSMRYMNNRRSRWPCGMRPIDCRYRSFESRWGHGCWSLWVRCVLCSYRPLWRANPTVSVCV